MPLVLKRRRGQSVVIGDADDAMIVSVRTATRGAAQFDCEPQRGRRGHRVRRRAGESFMVGEHVRVTVLDACRGSTKLSFEAPSTLRSATHTGPGVPHSNYAHLIPL
jgi:sRNA-binding carbon storage regulator CsrA